jgi:hypothetical protein
MTCTATHIKTLFEGHNRLPVRDRAFAESLLNTYSRYGSVSPKQAHWVKVLAERLAQPAPAEAVDVGGFGKLIEFFAAAAAKRTKLPKIILQLKGEGDEADILVKLVLSGPASQFPGAISVSQVGEYGVAPWYGRIHRDGKFLASREATPDGLIDLLKAFAADPAAVAAKHGRDTGICCFCNAELEDPRSKLVGYGPVCAKNHGLPWGAKPEAQEAPVAFQAPEPAPRPAGSLVALAAQLEGRS